MALFNVGQTVYANRTITTSASGDHPAFHHASPCDELIVIKHNDRFEHCYLLGRTLDDKYTFWASGKELMSQKPFSHNL